MRLIARALNLDEGLFLRVTVVQRMCHYPRHAPITYSYLLSRFRAVQNFRPEDVAA